MTNQQKILDLIHKDFIPHEGQVVVGKAMFVDGKKRIFVQCGRKWGKSKFIMYVMTRMAALTPNMNIYYFAPTREMAKEIIWRELQKFIPLPLLLESSVERAFKVQDLTIRLWN